MRKHADKNEFDHTNSVAYACGHPRMVENVTDILTRAGFRKDQIREEEYFKLHDFPSQIDHGHANDSSPSTALVVTP